MGASAQGSKREPQRILVLDDDDGVRRVMTTVLSPLGHEALVVGHSSEAFEAFERSEREQRPFEVAFIDLTMPGTSRAMRCSRGCERGIRSCA